MTIRKTEALTLAFEQLQLTLEIDTSLAVALQRQHRAQRVNTAQLGEHIEKALRAVLDAEFLKPPAASLSASPETAAGITALIVNSSRTVTRLLDMQLSEYGIAVEFAESAADAIALLEDKRYDIVFLGGVLADTQGYIICKAIKETPSRRHIPVIIITSRPSQFDKVRAALAGCDAYLAHPVPDDVFCGVLSRYLNIVVGHARELL